MIDRSDVYFLAEKKVTLLEEATEDKDWWCDGMNGIHTSV
jgi:hypothetical protein